MEKKRLSHRIVILTAVLFLFGLVGVVVLSSTMGCHKRRQEQKRLPTIHITTRGEIPWQGRTSCTIACVTWNDSTVWSGKIKFRGGVSSKYGKHSYALKLSEAHALCGLPEDRSFVLNASYIDKTFMRHKLCYDLFNMMDSDNIAPKCAYAVVRENGQPQGLYVIMQRLNKTVLKLNTDDTAAVIFKEPKIFYPDSKLPERGLFGDNYHGQTYPDFGKEDRNSLMEDLRRFLTGTPDEEFYAHIGEHIDLQNLIDWHLLLLFMNGGDNVLKNFYLYRQNSHTPYRIALWDCDHSLGRDGDNEKNMLDQMLEDDRNVLLNRMLKSEEHTRRLAGRYWELRRGGILTYENVERMMRENDPQVRAGLEENLKLWPFDSENYYDPAGYDEEYALILSFVRLSLQRLDGKFGYETTKR